MKALLRRIRLILKDRRVRKFFTRFVSGTAAIIVFVTTYALVLPAITMESEALCGIPAHQHDDSCYEKVLVCDLPEDQDHQHSESCYENRLICGLEVHTHSVACYNEELLEDEETSAVAATQSFAGALSDTGENLNSFSDYTGQYEETENASDGDMQVFGNNEEHEDSENGEADGFSENTNKNSLSEGSASDTETGLNENDENSENTANDSQAAFSEQNENVAVTGDSVDVAEDDTDAAAESDQTADFDRPVEGESGDTDTASTTSEKSANDNAAEEYTEDIGIGYSDDAGKNDITADETESGSSEGETVSENDSEEKSSETATGNTASEEIPEENASGTSTIEGSDLNTDVYIPALEPIDFNRVLTSSTGIYYYHADSETEEAEEKAPANSVEITDWKPVDENTTLTPEDLIRVYLRYTIPAGQLNTTNAVARYRLPGDLVLSEEQVTAINNAENGISAQFMDYDTLEVKDADAHAKYLGVEAIEGTRTPDQSAEEYFGTLPGSETDSQEYISATVKVENIFDTSTVKEENEGDVEQQENTVEEIDGNENESEENGVWIGQDLIFTFSPYTIEKNQHEYDASGQPAKAGKKVEGWLTLDFNMGQVKWIETETVTDEEIIGTTDEAAVDKEVSDDSENDENVFDQNVSTEDEAIVSGESANTEKQESPTNGTSSRENASETPDSDEASNAEGTQLAGKIIRKTTTINKEAEIIFVEETTEDKKNGIERVREISTTLHLEDVIVEEIEAANYDNDIDNDDTKTDDADNPEKKPDQVDTARGNEDDKAKGIEDKEEPDNKEFDTNQKESKKDKTSKAMPAMTFDDSVSARSAKLGSDSKNLDPLVDETTIQVHVEADEGTFPEGTTMHLTSLSGENMDAISQAVEGAVDTRTRGFHAIDITFRDAEGNDIEPEKPIRVSMTSEAIKKAVEDKSTAPVLVHVENPASEKQEGGEKEDPDSDRDSDNHQEKDYSDPAALKATVVETTENSSEEEMEGDKNNRKKEVDETNDTLSFESDTFSVYAVVYTVDFHWEVDGQEFVFSINGGDAIGLKELLPIIQTVKDDPDTEENEVEQFVENIETVEFSDESLLKVAKIEEDITAGALKDSLSLEPQYSGNLTEEHIVAMNEKQLSAVDWILIAMKSFQTEETLTVTMKNGDVFIVKVTDLVDPLGLEDRTVSIVFRNNNTGYSLQDTQGFEGSFYNQTHYITGRSATLTEKNGVIYCGQDATTWLIEYDLNYVSEEESTGKYYISAGYNSHGGDYLHFNTTGNYWEIVQGWQSATPIQIERDENDPSVYYLSDGNNHYLTKNSSGYNFGSTVGSKNNQAKMTFCIADSAGTSASHKATMMSAADLSEGQTVIIYQKIKQEDNTFKYYAIDADTTNHTQEVINSSDSLYWRGDLNLEWQVIAEKNDNGETTGYYYLYNKEKNVYLSPQGDGIFVLSNGQNTDKYRVSLPGKRDKTYSSKISNWDEERRVTSGLEIVEIKEDDDDVSTVIARRVDYLDSEEFYFAARDPIVQKQLSEVDTVDSNEIGIKITMYDFDGSGSGGRLDYMNDVIGTSGWTQQIYHPGIMKPVLVDGWPVNYSDNSLSDVFNQTTRYEWQTVWGPYTTDHWYQVNRKQENVNHLFIKNVYESTGYFHYSSFENFATLPENSSDFRVYEQVAQPSRSGDDDFDAYYMKRGNFFPFNDIDLNAPVRQNLVRPDGNVNYSSTHPRYQEDLYTTDGKDYFFGMTLEASFMQGPDGYNDRNDPMRFDFNGDDDLWVYIDNVLILDIGGVHDAFKGYIDFTDGTIHVDKLNTTTTDNNTTIKQRFKDAGIFPDGKPWVDDDAGEYFEGETFKDYSTHVFKMFYMERGAGASNLQIDFNMPIIKESSFRVTKQMPETATGHLIQSKYADAKFLYRAFVKDSENPYRRCNFTEFGEKASYTDGNPLVWYDEDGDGIGDAFELKPGQTAVFPVDNNLTEYYVEEFEPEGVQVTLRDSFAVENSDPEDGQPADYQVLSKERTVVQRGEVFFRNKPRNQMVNELQIKKRLTGKQYRDQNGNLINATETNSPYFEYKIYLEETDGTLKPYSLGGYYQLDERGYFVYYEDGVRKTKKFRLEEDPVTGEKTYYYGEGDNVEIKKDPLFTEHTSENGSIGDIRPGDTIYIVGLLVGTDFAVFERTDRSNIYEPEPLPEGSTPKNTHTYVYEGTETEDAYIRATGENTPSNMEETGGLFDMPTNFSELELDPRTAVGTIIVDKDAKVLVKNKTTADTIPILVRKNWSGISEDDEALADSKIKVTLGRYVLKDKAGTLTVQKTGVPEGVVFYAEYIVKDSDGNIIAEIPYGSDVKTGVTLSVAPGTYTVTEKIYNQDTGYSWHHDPATTIEQTKTLTAEITDDDSETVVFACAPELVSGTLYVKSSYQMGSGGPAVDYTGLTYTIYMDEECTIPATKINGTEIPPITYAQASATGGYCVNELKVGAYTVKESGVPEAPTGFQLTKTSPKGDTITVAVPENPDSAEVSFIRSYDVYVPDVTNTLWMNKRYNNNWQTNAGDYHYSTTFNAKPGEPLDVVLYVSGTRDNFDSSRINHCLVQYGAFSFNGTGGLPQATGQVVNILNNNRENVYPEEVTRNGQPYWKYTFHIPEVQDGASLVVGFNKQGTENLVWEYNECLGHGETRNLASGSGIKSLSKTAKAAGTEGALRGADDDNSAEAPAVDYGETPTPADAENMKYVVDTSFTMEDPDHLGQQIPYAVILDQDGDWTWDSILEEANLPATDPDGNLYYYYIAAVEETDVPETTSFTVKLDGEDKFIVGQDIHMAHTNEQWVPEPLEVNNVVKGSLNVEKKVTVDSEPTTTKLADGIYHFTAKGKAGTDTAGEERTIDIEIVDGEAVSQELTLLTPGTYTVTETTPTNGTALVSTQITLSDGSTQTGSNGCEVTVLPGKTGTSAPKVTMTNNINTTQLTVDKTWSDSESNQHEGDSVFYTLYRVPHSGTDGYEQEAITNVDDMADGYTGTLSEDNDWTETVTNLPLTGYYTPDPSVPNDQIPVTYTYYVAEQLFDGYKPTTTHTEDQDGYHFHLYNEKYSTYYRETEIDIQKDWIDADDPENQNSNSEHNSDTVTFTMTEDKYLANVRWVRPDTQEEEIIEFYPVRIDLYNGDGTSSETGALDHPSEYSTIIYAKAGSTIYVHVTAGNGSHSLSTYGFQGTEDNTRPGFTYTSRREWSYTINVTEPRNVSLIARYDDSWGAVAGTNTWHYEIDENNEDVYYTEEELILEILGRGGAPLSTASHDYLMKIVDGKTEIIPGDESIGLPEGNAEELWNGTISKLTLLDEDKNIKNRFYVYSYEITEARVGTEEVGTEPVQGSITPLPEGYNGQTSMYFVKWVQNTEGNWLLTNKEKPRTQVDVTKTWVNADHLPDDASVTVLLSAESGGAPFDLSKVNVHAEQVITKDSTDGGTHPDGWYYQWTNLPVTDNNGATITYSVTETAVSIGGVTFEPTQDHFLTGTSNTGNSFSLTNEVPPVTIDAKKDWTQTKLPANTSVTLKLIATLPGSNTDIFADLQQAFSLTVDQEKTLSGTDASEDNVAAWVATWTGLPQYYQKQKIDYTVVETEVKVEGNTIWSSASGSANMLLVSTITDDPDHAFVFTNKLPELTIKGAKQWLDASGEVMAQEQLTHGEKVTFGVYANGVLVSDASIELDGTADLEPTGVSTPIGYESEAWVASFRNLPKYDENAEEIIYTIKEIQEFESYTNLDPNGLPKAGVTPATDDNGILDYGTIRNRRTETNLEILAAKSMKDGETPETGAYQFTLEANPTTGGSYGPLTTSARPFEVTDHKMTVTNTEAAVDFGTIVFTLKDWENGNEVSGSADKRTFTYTVKEALSGEAGVITDQTEYLVTVTLTYNSSDGTMTSEKLITISPKENTGIPEVRESIEFINEERVTINASKEWINGSVYTTTMIQNAAAQIMLQESTDGVNWTKVTKKADGTDLTASENPVMMSVTDTPDIQTWKAQWSDLKKYRLEGTDSKLIQYRVVEINASVDDEVLVQLSDPDDVDNVAGLPKQEVVFEQNQNIGTAAPIENMLPTVDLEVNKAWRIGSGSNGWPDDIDKVVVELQQSIGGSEAAALEPAKTAEITEANWTLTEEAIADIEDEQEKAQAEEELAKRFFKNLPKYDNSGNLITYSVVETQVGKQQTSETEFTVFYSPQTTSTGGLITVTNAKDKPSSFIKKWIGFDQDITNPQVWPQREKEGGGKEDVPITITVTRRLRYAETPEGTPVDHVVQGDEFSYTFTVNSSGIVESADEPAGDPNSEPGNTGTNGGPYPITVTMTDNAYTITLESLDMGGTDGTHGGEWIYYYHETMVKGYLPPGYQKTTDQEPIYSDSEEYATDEGGQIFNIIQTYVLPNSGGSGTYRFRILGSLLIMLAGAGFIIMMYKRRNVA